MRIVLINAPLKSAVCDWGVGHQMPLGLLMVGGPLLDAGYPVKLIDAAHHHLRDTEIVQEIIAFAADVVLIGHVGSTSAHLCCLRVLRALKATRPQVITVYGGVHPTYHDRAILAEHPQVDVIVRGEGEETVLDLVRALARRSNTSSSPCINGWEDDLPCVQSITWRKQGAVRRNPSRIPLQNLDAPRIGWELIEDWDLYRAFGLGRAAVVQFSRGCPHLCTYCGQWMFWKRWRHREVMRFVDEIAWLHREHGVQFFWLADENPTTLKDVWRSVLEEIVRRNLSIGWCGSIRAQDIVRDADILELYKQSGCLYVLMGIETLTEESLARVRKESCIDDGYQAVRLLRRHNIMSIVDYLFGLDEETPHTLWRALRGLLRYESDFVNALYLTPHAWTPPGHELKNAPIVEPDLWKWDYRHQVIGVGKLSPTQLFMGVKAVEGLYHLHPRRLWRMIAVPDPRLRQQLRFSFWHTAMTFWYEVYEHFADRVGGRWFHRPSLNR